MIFVLLYFCFIVLTITNIKSTKAIHTDFCYSIDCKQYCLKDDSIDITDFTEQSSLEKSITNNVYKLKEMSSGPSLNELYRPRSALARALYEKQRNDRQLRDFDKTEWYRVVSNRLTPLLQQKFVQLHADDETKEFLATSMDKSSWLWTQIWYLVAKAVLKHFWSVTDINGWLGRGSMFVLSAAQASRLLLGSEGEPGGGRESLLDLGAGDGAVSGQFAHFYRRKYATEISTSMRSVLVTKGYTILDAEDWWRSEEQFSCVCMLNLLDRCSHPRSMLQQARAALVARTSQPEQQHPRLLIALVLPYKPYVEATSDHKPLERLPIEGASVEEQAASFVQWMEATGWSLQAWSRVPYLCEGDFSQSYYWLDDTVYVFTPTLNDHSTDST